MIKSQDGVMPTPEAISAEMARLEAAVDAFAAQMKARLAAKLAEGRSGWDDPANAPEIYSSMLAHGAGVQLAAGQEVDVANFALFLWFMRTRAGQP